MARLQLDSTVRYGVQTLHRRTEPATGPWWPTVDELKDHVERVDRCGYDSIWTGDHVAFAIPFLDPLLQLAQVAVLSRRLMLGTGVYLLPLRHPGPVAKMVSTLDLLAEGRFVFGVGVGGEFPSDYAACGVPIKERGSRLTESMQVLRKLWRGEKMSHAGPHYPFDDVLMLPPPRQPGGPPLWCGGRSEAALARTATLGDGWLSYVVTPQQYAECLAKMESVAERAGQAAKPFGTGHLIFLRIDDDADAAFREANKCLSVRYAMDFTKATRRYAAVGAPRDVAAQLRAFHAAGVRHFVLDFVGPYEDRDRQIERFANDVRPLLRDLV